VAYFGADQTVPIDAAGAHGSWLSLADAAWYLKADPSMVPLDMRILDKKLKRIEYGINRVNCAQIVPVKVKYFQTVPNETKSWLKKLNRINWLYLLSF
jgi:hypothetical protein